MVCFNVFFLPLAQMLTSDIRYFRKIDIPDNKSMEIVVEVDLKTRKIVYTVDRVTIEAGIQKPLKSITHVGYVMDSALIDFAPIEISTP